MASEYNLQIITPDGKLFEGQVTSFNAPGEEGVFSVLAKHTPMVSKIKSGTAKITQNENEKLVAIGEGVVEVAANHNVLVLSNSAHFVDASGK